jgi:hypothetical protein
VRYLSSDGDEDDVVGFFENAVATAAAAAEKEEVHELSEHALDSLDSQPLQDDFPCFGVAFDVDDGVDELASEGVEDGGDGGGEGEEEGVLAVRGDDGGLEVEGLVGFDGLLGGFPLVVAGQRHQRLVLVLLVGLQLERVHI